MATQADARDRLSTHADFVASSHSCLPDRVGGPAEPRVVHCEQAIFTSLPSRMGTGYRIVAASRGIRAGERRDITARSPSHGGLCDASPEAMAMAYYPLSDGRCCVAYITSAGAEHTGRGGQTVYTRALVLARDDFRRFGLNPFGVLRALEHSGQTTPDLAPPHPLPPLELVPTAGEGRAVASAVIARLPAVPDGAGSGGQGLPGGSDGLLMALAALLNEQPVIVVVEDGGQALAETVLMALPAPLRIATSVACGLRFSSARGTRLNCVSGDVARTRDMLHGHPITWVDLCSSGDGIHRPCAAAGAERPSAADADAAEGWVKMVARRWSRRQFADLGTLTDRWLEDPSRDGRERISRIVLDSDRVSAADMATALAILRTYLDAAGENETEFELIERLLIATQRRFSEQIAAADADVLRSQGAELVELALRCPEAAALLLPAYRRLLTCAAALDPVLAARWAAMLAAQSQTLNIAGVDEVLAELLDRLPGTVATLSEAQLVALRAALAEWAGLPPDATSAARVSALSAAVCARLTTASAGSASRGACP
jgi:hypothetical protein